MNRNVHLGALAWALAALVVLPVRAQEAEAEAPPPSAVPSVPDAVQFYQLDQVTVVYPAGPGEDLERNRRSAHLRARYLELVGGMRVKEVADDQVGDEEKAGNLLVLGWNNRVFTSMNARDRPFYRTENGFAFLGLEHDRRDDDLMFYAHSPFQAGRFVFFWSRIDPELDRFQILPFVGSNWAVFRDFTVMRQGMYEGGTAWPPVRNPLAEVDRTERFAELDATRKSARSKHYEIVYPGTDEAADRSIATILEAREAAFARAAAVLGAPPEAFRIRLTVYRDVEDKKERSGIEDAAHSVPGKGEIHMTERLARNPSPHEEIHVLARQLLGPCVLTSLYEGLALSDDGAVAGTELDVHAALLVEADKLPSLAMLFDEASFRALPESVAFPASGLMVGWLRTLGKDLLGRVYPLKEGGVDAVARLASRPRKELEDSFRSWARDRARTRKQDLVFLKEQSAAQERYRLGDFAGVAAALSRALKAKPDDPQTLFNLAAAQIRTGSYADAGRNLRKLLSLSLSRKDTHLAVFSHYQLGRLFDVQGRREEALSEYRRVLELPDAHDAHRLAREAIATPVTKEHLD